MIACTQAETDVIHRARSLNVYAPLVSDRVLDLQVTVRQLMAARLLRDSHHFPASCKTMPAASEIFQREYIGRSRPRQ